MKRQSSLYLINALLLVFSLVVFATGIIKFPGLLQAINIDPYQLNQGLVTALHDWLGLGVVLLALVHIIMHLKWLSVMTVKLVKTQPSTIVLALVIIAITIGWIYSSIERPAVIAAPDEPLQTQTSDNELPETDDEINDLSATRPMQIGEINIQNIGTFQFDPQDIHTKRSDVFQPGYFSLFDILVYLHESGQIEMDYYFDEGLDTHIITTINGLENWWYIAYYDGGWPEQNAWRMDLYPYKDKTSLQIRVVDEDFLTSIHQTFKAEMLRLESNNGKTIIPEVIIRGRSERKVFTNVPVKAYNLRNDYLIDGTITALDVVLSLSERGDITHQLNWYESIGSAGIVKNYFVDAIDEDITYDRCGFVYEVGSHEFARFMGNHIHIPSDLRVLTSPDYVEFFWICI